MSSALFSPISLRALDLPNRIVVSPMCQYEAVEGSATDWHIMNLGQYAMGAAGLVFTEATHVSDVGRISPKCLGLYRDDNEAALKRVVDFCRRYGVTVLGTQLAHAGRKASTLPPAQGRGPVLPAEGGWEVVGPSALPFGEGWLVPRALTVEEIREITAQFVAATERAERIGFDAIELHAAHGYLMHSFLSPLSNQRDDAYGGSLDNRMRFVLETFEAVRAVWPADKPLGIRISATDWVEGAWDIEDSVVLAKQLDALGCDFIDVSSGGLDPRQTIDPFAGYQIPFAERMKQEVSMKVMAVGKIIEPQQAEDIVASGKADFVAMARAMMDDPRWAWHAARALGAETAYSPNYARCAPNVWPGR